MKKLFLIFSLTLSTILYSQDTVRLKHTNYETVFDIKKRYPTMVEWWSTKKLVVCTQPLKRKDTFKPDPQLPKETDLMQDYVNSGTDRGHMMPAADNLCQTREIADECFYFSNISPQYHSLNAGDWKSLETFIRQQTVLNDSIKVWCGNVGEITKIGKVSVPKYCWKVFFIKKDNKMRAFLFENTRSKPDGFEDNEVPVEKITQLTGFKFLGK